MTIYWNEYIYFLCVNKVNIFIVSQTIKALPGTNMILLVPGITNLIISSDFNDYPCALTHWELHIDGLMEERRNSIANALELRLSCTNPSIWCKEWPTYHVSASMMPGISLVRVMDWCLFGTEPSRE